MMAGLMMAALAVAMPGALPGERYPQRALGSGALIGLALAVKATSLVLLPFAVLLLVRDRRSGKKRCVLQQTNTAIPRPIRSARAAIPRPIRPTA